MENTELFKSILKRLDVLIALHLNPKPEGFSVTESVSLLDRFNLGNTEIAEILTTSSNTVNVIKNRIKNKRK